MIDMSENLSISNWTGSEPNGRVTQVCPFRAKSTDVPEVDFET